MHVALKSCFHTHYVAHDFIGGIEILRAFSFGKMGYQDAKMYHYIAIPNMP